MELIKDYKVLVGVPCGTHWNTEFGTSLAMMFAWSAVHKWSPTTNQQYMDLQTSRGSMLPKLRTTIVENALKNGHTHILFLDSDHSFPKDILGRLICHHQQVVAVNCVTKEHPSAPTARKQHKDSPYGGQVFHTRMDNFGLEQTWRVGTGIMLVNTKVFRKIKPPWFQMEWRRHEGEWQLVGEDWTFCEKLQAAGIPIFVDHDLSKECGHIGAYNYTLADVFHPDDVAAVKDAMKEVANAGGV